MDVVGPARRWHPGLDPGRPMGRSTSARQVGWCGGVIAKLVEQSPDFLDHRVLGGWLAGDRDRELAELLIGQSPQHALRSLLLHTSRYLLFAQVT
jgi:hypothetical protein